MQLIFFLHVHGIVLKFFVYVYIMSYIIETKKMANIFVSCLWMLLVIILLHLSKLGRLMRDARLFERY